MHPQRKTTDVFVEEYWTLPQKREEKPPKQIKQHWESFNLKQWSTCTSKVEGAR